MRVIPHLTAAILILFVSGFLLITTDGIFKDSETVLLNVGLGGIEEQQTAELEINFQEQRSGQTNNYIIEEFVANGSFNQDFEFWDYWGDAVVGELNNNKYLRLGSKNSSNLVQQNCIRQNLELTRTPIFLSMDVWQFTDEVLPGFDTAGLIVNIDNKPILIKKLTNTDSWQPIVLRLPVLQTGEHELMICSGSSGDRSNSSWVYIDNITTAAAAVSDTSSLSLNTNLNDTWVRAEYELNSGLQSEQALQQLDLIFLEEIQDNRLQLSLLNQDWQELLNQELKLYYFDQTPLLAVDLVVNKLEENRYLLSFANNDYSSDTFFKVLAADAPDEFENGQQLCRAELFYPNLSMDLYRPHCLNETCLLSVDITDCQLEAPWLSVDICDPALNCSGLSNPVFVQAQQVSPTPTPAHTYSPAILINEIMFNPEGNDGGENLEGEWVELFNSSEIALDLANWSIADKADNEVKISAFNSCASLQDLEFISQEGCSNVISPNAYLLVFVNGSPILNNSGDELRLSDSDGKIVDQVDYPGSAVEGKTYGRVPDGAENWQPRLPATPFGLNPTE